MISKRPHIVILGGGFGGMNAARTLDRTLRRRLDADVTLISRTNFYLFTPLLAEVAASLVGPRHVVNPIRRLVRGIHFVEGTVRSVDPDRRTIEFRDENTRTRTLEYDHCVLALGSVTEFFGIPGLAAGALTLKTLGDAIRIRNHAIDLFERAALLSPEERGELLTFVVAGGGLNGVEVAGELHDFLLRALEDYPTIDPRELRMVLVEMMDRLAQEVPAEAATWATRNLESRGIEVWLKARVEAYTDGRLRIADGREIMSETVIWTAGVRPSPLVQAIRVERVRGDHRLPVNEFLQVRGYETLWAVGDCALVPDAGGAYQPPTAQHAVRQGRRVARNIEASLAGRALKAHRYRGIGMLATLGRHRGLGRVLGIRLTGLPAWFAWRTYYLLALPGWDRRIRVAFDWFLDFVFPPDIVELKVEPLHTGQEVALETTPTRERDRAATA